MLESHKVTSENGSIACLLVGHVFRIFQIDLFVIFFQATPDGVQRLFSA